MLHNLIVIFVCVKAHSTTYCSKCFGPTLLSTLLAPFHPMTEQCTRHLTCISECKLLTSIVLNCHRFVGIVCIYNVIEQAFFVDFDLPNSCYLFVLLSHTLHFACLAQG